jgi:predicted amidophosphoribosyltransferase
MDDGDGALTMELQAQQIAMGQTLYNGSKVCPGCKGLMNPVEFIQNRGLCQSCLTQQNSNRVKGGMV